MKKIIFIAIVLLSFGVEKTFSQTTNTGVFTILPNTEVTVTKEFQNNAGAYLVNNGALYLNHHFTNNGTCTFDSQINDGTTYFVGTSMQEVAGKEASHFLNIVFDNTASDITYQLKNSVYVYGQVDFSMGIIYNDLFDGQFIFQEDADFINASNSSYVNGTVQKNGDTEFRFPIGKDGLLRSASISAPADIQDEIQATYFLENSNATHPHDLKAGIIDYVEPNEYWSISQQNGSSHVAITLTWDENTTSSHLLNAPKTSLHVLRWDGTQGFWVDEGGFVDEGNRSVTTVAEVSGYGVFTLGTIKEEHYLEGGLVVYNGVSPNGDGKNDFFFIDGIVNFPTNSVKIFNRWGVKVFETQGYNESDNVFNGTSEGRLTVNSNEKLPTGTYFYVLNYEVNNKTVKKSGYLYLNND
ncbi:gliding motility-associated C-terminal domain-containing protein [Pseudotenacibaculum haliotis]|uniref:Gliding motility-associated C-terminal domain-containing protein n=1 Tax=Pseudotenacibaculum haliotis TaxID=1862138 RepID=A0ABW5LMQ8_9FLAO